MARVRKLVLDWTEAGIIDPDNLDSAMHIAGAGPTRQQWLTFSRTALLFCGIIATCAGIIFFFAYNWEQLGKFSKFLLMESVFVLTALGFFFVRTDNGKVRTALMSGLFVLTGAFLALIGQTYQTGADTWELFATWALLCAPFVLLGRSSTLWILGLAVSQMAMVLYCRSFRTSWWVFSFAEVSLYLSLSFNLLIGLLLEALYLEGALSRRLPENLRRLCGLQNRHAARVSMLAAGVSIACLVIVTILDWEAGGLIAAILFPVWVVGNLYSYRFLRRDLLLVSASTLSVVIVIVTFFARILFSQNFDGGGFILLAGITVGVSTPAVMWLKRLSRPDGHPGDASRGEGQTDVQH